MNEARPFASLSSGLLARKGAAKPAMRPQGYSGGFEDLGWNDMGHHEPLGEELGGDLPEHVPSSIAALTPAPKHPAQPEAAEPEVVAQQRAIAESFAPEEAESPAPVKAPAPVVALPKRAAAAAAEAPHGKKAAFTLRLDGERHLRLRLATAVTGRSAQQIVTEALDHFLASVPEVEALAERVPASGGRKS
ncbi:MAG TPA: hypothetical protein VGW40_05870 [Allosphingosinicella sp.]|nr:hypothetical protein [Allosphingosinicella sp.]